MLETSKTFCVRVCVESMVGAMSEDLRLQMGVKFDEIEPWAYGMPRALSKRIDYPTVTTRIRPPISHKLTPTLQTYLQSSHLFRPRLHRIVSGKSASSQLRPWSYPSLDPLSAVMLATQDSWACNTEPDRYHCSLVNRI